MDISDVAASNVTKCKEFAQATGIIVTLGNVHMSKTQGGALHIETNGGHLDECDLMSSVSFRNISINSECLGKVKMNEKEFVNHKTRVSQHAGILALLPEETRLVLELEVLKVKDGCKELGKISVMNYLSTEKVPLLQDMVNIMQNEGGKKWSTLSRENLLQNMLQQHNNLLQLCTHVDLNIIAKIIKKYTCKDTLRRML